MDNLDVTYTPKAKKYPQTGPTSIRHYDEIPVVALDETCGMILLNTSPKVGRTVFCKPEIIASDPGVNSESVDLVSEHVKNEDEDLCEAHNSRKIFKTYSSSSSVNCLNLIKSEEPREDDHWDQPQYSALNVKNEAPFQSFYFGNASGTGSKKHNAGHHRYPSTDFSSSLTEQESIFDPFARIKTEVKEEDDDLIDSLHTSVDIKDDVSFKSFECVNDTGNEDTEHRPSSDIHNTLHYFPTASTKLEEIVNDHTLSQRLSKIKTRPKLQNYVEHKSLPNECLSVEFPSPNKFVESDNKQLISSHFSVFFADKDELKQHILEHTGEKPFSCGHSSASFARNSHLQGHIEHIGEKPFKCSHCSTSFAQKSSLKLHIRKHTGEKPFSCSLCSASFTQKGNLKRHTFKHTGEKPFSCVHCSASFAGKSDLKRHTFKHTGEKPFSCGHCSASFTQKGRLKRHTLKHTGEEPFSCGHCSASISHKGDFKRHTFKHTEKPFSCSHCSASFSRKGNLKRHTIKHTGEKPFS